MTADLNGDAGERIPPFPQLCKYMSERSPQPMVAVDGKTHVVSYANPAFAQLVGRTVRELVSRQFAEVVPEGTENGCLALLDRVFGTGIPENLAEQVHRQTHPEPVYWSYAMWPILGARDQPVGVMIQITDATEIARFRQQSVAVNESLLVAATEQHELTQVAEALSARRQAAVRARDHFLAVLSHELRNPLAALSNGLQLLKLTPHNGDVAVDSREMMERQLTHMVRLVDDLLDVSRIATGKLDLHKEKVELAAVVNAAVEASRAFIDSRGQELTVALPSAPIVLDADSARLTQVFLNLLNNAAKYSDPNQKIQVTARVDGSEVEVSVRDYGVGIAAAKLPQIFEAFMQVDASWERSQGGMGIGLSLVKQFVELHDGTVEVCSLGLGQGSEFLVRLPVDAAEVSEPEAVVEKGSVRQCRILVVDDNHDAARSMSMILQMLGHETRTAYEGEAALVIAREYKPDLVLMDLGMPHLDGYEAARRLRSEQWGAEIFLVALTGWGAAEDRRRTKEGGFDGHLVKPVGMAELQSLLENVPY